MHAQSRCMVAALKTYPLQQKLRVIALRAFEPKENIVAKGTVKWFNDQKGYGFIVPDDGSEDLFVHHSNINGTGFKTLAEGQAVEYVSAEGRKGPEAQNVTPC